MARVTVEDCLENVKNRFELVMLASKRARQLMRGSSEPKVAWENDKATVVALREIAMGYTDFTDAHHAEQLHAAATDNTGHAALSEASTLSDADSHMEEESEHTENTQDASDHHEDESHHDDNIGNIDTQETSTTGNGPESE